MPSQLLIGIDGGATRCLARIRDMDGNLLGEGEGGPANIHSDFSLAKQSIRAATKSALAAAGLNDSSLKRIHAGLGLAGAGVKTAYSCLLAELTSFASMQLETDAYVAWLGAHQGDDGGIAILGTGSCGLAIVKGRRVAVAGWGPDVSDEAGGQRMGREALRRTLWAYDGRAERSGLTAAILTRFDGDPTQIVTFAAKASSADYARFAPLIFQPAPFFAHLPHRIRLVHSGNGDSPAFDDREAARTRAQYGNSPIVALMRSKPSDVGVGFQLH